MDHNGVNCRNCQSPLTGQYCSQCGQREGRPDIQFSEAAGELIGDVFTRDSRLWRTLFCLVFRPGFLPAEFMAGHRVRYVPPFRLYLITSFVLFLALSAGSRIWVVEQPDALSPAVQAELPANAEDGDVYIGLGNREDGDEQRQSATVSLDLADEDSPAWLQAFERRLEANANKLEGDTGQFIELLMEYLPQMMFLLLPLFALLLKLCYLFSPFHYLQHLVFAFYYHCFAYLAYLAGVVVERLNIHVDGVLVLAALIYLPIALWRAYGSGIAGALGKAVVIWLAYGIMLVLGFAVVTIITLALM